MLLLSRPLLTELTDDLFAQLRGFAEHFVQPVEDLFQVFCADWSPVRHWVRKDYGITDPSVKLSG